MAEDQGDSMVNGTKNNEIAIDENVPAGEARTDGNCAQDDERQKTREAELVVVTCEEYPSVEGSSSTKEREEAIDNENTRILESISSTSTRGTKCTDDSGKDCGTGSSQDDSVERVPESEEILSEETSSKKDKTSQDSVGTEERLTNVQKSETNIDAIISEEERKLNKILKSVRSNDVAENKDLSKSRGEQEKDDNDDNEAEEEEEEKEIVDDNEQNDDDAQQVMHIDEMTSSDAKEEENDDEAFVDTSLVQEGQKTEAEEEESAEDSRPSEDRRIELTEVGIVGPPTAVSELINEEELRTESALPTEEKLQDHVAEWVQNTARAEDLTIGAEETRSRRSGEEVERKRRRRRRKRTTTKKKTRKSNESPSIPAPTRKSQRIVSNIIKKSIKCSRRFWRSKRGGGGGEGGGGGSSGGKHTLATIWCKAATSNESTGFCEEKRRNKIRISSIEEREEEQKEEEEEEEVEEKRKIVVIGKRETRKMPQCAVATCRNSHRRTRGRRIRYHRFPQIPEVRARWVRACGRVPLANGDIPFNIQTARICSLHFTNDSYEKDMEHLVLGLPVRSRLRRGAVPTVGVPVNVQPVTRMLVEDAKRSLLKVAHAKILTGQKMANGVAANESRQQDEQQQQQQCIVVQKQQRQRNKNVNEQKMAGIDVLLALGLKPASRLNKMHAMDGTGGNGKRPETDKIRESHGVDVARGSTRVPLSQQNGAALPEETATTADQVRPPATAIKKEPVSESEPDSADVVSELTRTATRTIIKSDGMDGRKRRSSDEPLTSNGGNAASKRACLEQREQFITSLVGNDKASAEELAARADQLRAEVQALDELARAKEMEWNEILSMRKLKEEAYLRLERRRQVVGFMEGNGELIDSLPPASLALDSSDWDNGSASVKDNKIGYGSLQDGSPPSRKDKIVKLQPHRQSSSPKLGESGRKQAVDSQNLENRQIGEGRQGPIVDVRSIIADYRLRHPETVPRRGRRMRNSVNVGLGAGGAMVETGHTVDSRPSSTDSCKSNPNAADPNSSMSFKDVLVQFAKLSQQQGEPVKTPQNYPDVTLHPVAPSPSPQSAAPQQTGSLLHGILTKSQSPRPTTFSPTLARLLTAPERERNTTVAASTPQQNATTQHLLQAYQGSNPVFISDLLSSSKARTEITITPVVNTSVQSHSNSLVHVDDVEEETTVIEERGTRASAGVRDNREEKDNPPRCQGCHERAAQFVCAGCGNQWYCSRECQVSAWDDHSEVCSG